uniref:Uncharacterized protein n=1 Tax=Ackermannviridae sp. TaxID=2831612 RepID=A0A8S5VPF1_9CAUD|nr:MAG TPA: hypothetical protein [Ackermannviridae sp.]
MSYKTALSTMHRTYKQVQVLLAAPLQKERIYER